jgi:hypothetical protein
LAVLAQALIASSTITATSQTIRDVSLIFFMDLA